MTTFSSLSHWKRLPRATGTVNFDIERGRAAPSRQKSVAVAAPRSHSRRDAITHAAASDCAGRACGGAALACQLRPAISVPKALTAIPCQGPSPRKVISESRAWPRLFRRGACGSFTSELRLHTAPAASVTWGARGVLTVLAHLIERGDYEDCTKSSSDRDRRSQGFRRGGRAPAALNGDGGVTAWAESPADRRELPQRCASCSNPRPREAV